MNKVIKYSLMSLGMFGIVGSIFPAKEPGLYIEQIVNESGLLIELLSYHNEPGSAGPKYPGAKRDLPTPTKPIRVPTNFQLNREEIIRVISNPLLQKQAYRFSLVVKGDTSESNNMFCITNLLSNCSIDIQQFPSNRVVTATLYLRTKLPYINVPNEDRATLKLNSVE
ncbi:hypothetical protein HOM50_03460 [bacterium]|nr:hypothetical protein [bacterium]MBT5015435.1 hypothetical protein [bacterium]